MHESLSQTTYNELIKSKAGLVSTRAARAPWTLSGMNLSCYKTLCVFLFPPNHLSSLSFHTVFSCELLSLPALPPLLSCLPPLTVHPGPSFPALCPSPSSQYPFFPNLLTASHLPPPPFRKTHFQESFRQRSLVGSARPEPLLGLMWLHQGTPRAPSSLGAQHQSISRGRGGMIPPDTLEDWRGVTECI